ncbi:hypothetical protein KC721_02810 [Candidatus Woesebacteria bacterium]|nr:hypothetical protein [Candidatus Woesebacteria bacterium]
MFTQQKKYVLALIIATSFLQHRTSVLAQSSQSPEVSEIVATDSATEATTTPPPVNLQPLSLTLSPPTLLLETDPAEPVSSSFQVFNNSTEDEYLQLSVLKFTADQTGSSPILQEFEPEDDFKNWLSFNEERFTITPTTWKTIQVTFTPPPSASLSYYYAIVISRQSNPNPGSGETAVVGAPALLTLVTVNSPFAKQELQLKNFIVTKKMFEFLPVEFELTVENTGNIYLAPIGNIFINSSKKSDVGVIQINASNGLILPGSTRTFKLSWDDGFPRYETQQENGKIVYDSSGNPKKKLSWDLTRAQLFRFGKFTGHLVFIYDNGMRDVPTESIVDFWVIPVRLLAVAGVLLLLVLIGICLPLFMVIKKLLRKTGTTTKSTKK